MNGLLRTVILSIWAALLLLPGLAAAEPKYRLVIMPKLIGIDYYDAAKRGVDDAARELPDMEGLKGIIVLGAPNPPGVARAVKEAGFAGKVAVVGNSTPNLMRGYLKDGTVKKVLLWNAPDHGYLTVYCAYRLVTGALKPGIPFEAGRLGSFTPKRDALTMQVALPVLTFTKEKVDRYQF